MLVASKSLNSSYGYCHLPGKFLEGSAWGSCLKDSIYTDNNLYSGWNAECSHVTAMLNPPDTLLKGIWAKEGSCTNKAFWLNQCPPRCCITHARPVDCSANHILLHLHIVYSYFHVQNHWKHHALHVYNNGCGSICEKLHSWAPLFLLLLSSFRRSSANRQPKGTKDFHLKTLLCTRTLTGPFTNSVVIPYFDKCLWKKNSTKIQTHIL